MSKQAAAVLSEDEAHLATKEEAKHDCPLCGGKILYYRLVINGCHGWCWMKEAP